LDEIRTVAEEFTQLDGGLKASFWLDVDRATKLLIVPPVVALVLSANTGRSKSENIDRLVLDR
jgi:hypothetical protein